MHQRPSDAALAPKTWQGALAFLLPSGALLGPLDRGIDAQAGHVTTQEDGTRKFLRVASSYAGQGLGWHRMSGAWSMRDPEYEEQKM